MTMQLNKFFGIQYPLNFPDDIIDDVVVDNDNKTDLDILNEDDEDAELPKENEDENSEEEEEVKEDKKEIKDEINEDEIVRLNWRGLREKFEEKYPELFKDPEFKKVKNTIYREQEYAKLFPDPKDAEEALEAQSDLSSLRSLVMSGDTDTLLKNIGDVSEKSLDSFASSFLPSLRSLDSKLYAKVTTPVINRILRDVISYGENHDHKETGENFVKAAKVVAKAVFGKFELGEVEDTKKPNKELEDGRKEILDQKQKLILDSLVEETDSELKRLIGDIDPGKVLKDRPRLKDKILNEIIDEVKKALENDRAHGTKMGSLWARERQDGFSGKLKDSIKTTFLSRAKVLLPEIRKKVRAEYLGHVKDSDKDLSDKLKNRNKNVPIGQNLSSSGKKIPTAKEAKEKKMTDKDILNID